MTTSGNYDFSLNTYQIIVGALRLINALQSGEVPPDDEYDDALKALNGMVKLWQASGIHVWCETDYTLFLQPGQIQYSIGASSTDHVAFTSDWVQTATTATRTAAATSIPVSSIAGIANGDQIGIWLDSGVIYWTTVSGTPSGLTVTLAAGLPSQALSGAQVVAYTDNAVRPLRVPAGRRYTYTSTNSAQQAISTPMSVFSRIDYWNSTTNKTNPGTPTQFFYDPMRGPLGQMNVWPNPNSPIYCMQFTGQRPLQDFVGQADTADFPEEWVSALRFNLARELAPEYDCPPQRFEMVTTLATEKFTMCSMWDREVESVYFGLEGFPASRN